MRGSGGGEFHSLCVDVREQHGIRSLLPPLDGPCGPSSGCQAREAGALTCRAILWTPILSFVFWNLGCSVLNFIYELENIFVKVDIQIESRQQAWDLKSPTVCLPDVFHLVSRSRDFPTCSDCLSSWGLVSSITLNLCPGRCWSQWVHLFFLCWGSQLHSLYPYLRIAFLSILSNTLVVMALSLSEAKISTPGQKWAGPGWGQRAAGQVWESPARANGVGDAVADLLVSIAGFRQQPEQRNLVSSWHV